MKGDELDRYMGQAGEPPAGQVESSVEVVWERLKTEAEHATLPARGTVVHRRYFTVAAVAIATLAVGLYAAQRSGLLTSMLPVRQLQQPTPPQPSPAVQPQAASVKPSPAPEPAITAGVVVGPKEPAINLGGREPAGGAAAEVARVQSTDAGAAGRGTARRPEVVIHEIKPNLYVVTGPGALTTVRVTPAGVIVVDTKNPGDQNYDDLMTQIRRVTDKPVKYVVVTNHNLDHTGNIGKFIDAGAQVIGHDNLKYNMTAHEPPYRPDLGLRPPSATYAKDMTIELGGVKVEIHHYARSNTSGDSIVYFPDLKVVSSGDCVVGTAPFFNYPFGGSAVEWQNVLVNIEKLDFDTLVPGHPGEFNGLTTTKADFMSFKTKFDTMMARANDLVLKGTPKDSFLSQFKVDDLGWSRSILQQQLGDPTRLDAFYAELQSGKARPLP